MDGAPDDLMTLLGLSSTSAEIKAAISFPAGARFYNSALQVNPYSYGQRHAVDAGYQSEAEYNQAMVAAARQAGIEVVAVTDHFRVASSATLVQAFEDAGIIVFPGFEANSSEGIHLLCLFEPGTSLGELEQHIGACRVADRTAQSPISTEGCEALLRIVTDLGGLCVAPHVCSASGLLATLRGTARALIWKSEYLLAVGLPGPRREAPEQYREILANKDGPTERLQPICVLNANDVSRPTDFALATTSCRIKMTQVSVEGLRQSFMDWESRVRLHSDMSDSDHIEVVAVGWRGGLFDGQSLHLNSGLNVLVGGRGAGKSTMIESLRFAFDVMPRGAEARRSHGAITAATLGSGASVSVLIRSPIPSPQHYLIERIYGQRPVIRDERGEVLQVSPTEVIGPIDIFGQHEISELTRQPEQLAEILRRFTAPDADHTEERKSYLQSLEASRKSIVQAQDEISEIEDVLAALPGLRENLRRFETAGLKEKLAEKTSIDAEDRIFGIADQALVTLENDAHSIDASDEDARSFVPDDGAKLPNHELLAELDAVSATIHRARKRAARFLRASAQRAREKAATIKVQWTPLQQAANDRYEAMVKELEADGHDPKKFVSIQNQVEALKPKEALRKAKGAHLEELLKARADLLRNWEAFKAEDLRELKKAARRVTERLKGTVRVTVQSDGDLGKVGALLKDRVTGNISQALERLRGVDDLGLSVLANHIRNGAQSLITAYGFSQASADKIAQGGNALALEVEQCELPSRAIVELNIGAKGAEAWKTLDELSTGQKATAVLLLLLLESRAPLIVDQPEDDLDNHFIADTIVPAMRSEKGRRQFIFSSHNANIPVLGDAEQIIGLKATVEGGFEHVSIDPILCGSIDVASVNSLVKEVLEGGKRAFLTRRLKYGF